MTADIRTAAQREAEDRVTRIREQAGFADEHVAWFAPGFEAGAVWGAARVMPTREQVANELGRHWYDANLEMCDCGWDQPTAKDTSYDNHLADAVLALIAGTINEGGSCRKLITP